jgi:serine/threonine-protein kinase
MDAARWERMHGLFNDALALPETDRPAFLREACAGDPLLLEETLALLAADASAMPLLDAGLEGAARSVLEVAEPTEKSIGPYRLLRLLGEGGMGVVFLAQREDLGNQVAIKILRDASLSPARRGRFAIEQRTLARLVHPAIAQLHDAAVLPDGTPYFVMEYVEGLPLTTYCERHECSLVERLRLFRALCEAVRFAHGHAIVHRDLKPSNVLVTEAGAVKLLDFGISKHLEVVDAPVDQTRTALRLMTPAYAAPEQLRGEPVGTYTDVYALGVILYELITGRLPYLSSGRAPGIPDGSLPERTPVRPSLVLKRAGASPRGLAHSPLRGVARADLDVLCLTALQQDARRRYGSVEGLIRDLDHLRSGEPLEARPDTAGYRVRKFLRRRWRPVAAATLVAATFAAVMAFYTTRLATARDAALTEASRAQRIQAFTVSLFEGGDETVGPADTLRVVSLLDRGVREARALDTEPAVQADFYETLGGIYRKLGRLRQADSLLQISLRQRRSIFGRDDPEVSSSLVALGLLRVDQARLDEAERLVREATLISRRHLAPDDPRSLQATSALGLVLQERGEYAAAIAVLDTVVARAGARDATSAEFEGSLRNLADTHFYAGHYDRAASLYGVLLAMERKHFGDRHPRVAGELVNLGAIQFQQGRYAAAERLYRQALEITRAYYGPDHHEYASNLTMIGRSLLYQDRYDEARELLSPALQIQTRVYGPVSPQVASILNELGNLAVKVGDRESAEAYFTRTAAIYRSVYGEHHYLVGISLSNLGSVYLEAGENARAEVLYRRAVELFSAALAPDDLNTGIARIKLGRALLRQRRYRDAEREILAGYRIVGQRSEPTVSWLQAARSDLASLYAELGRREEAERFRRERARYAKAGE